LDDYKQVLLIRACSTTQSSSKIEYFEKMRSFGFDSLKTGSILEGFPPFSFWVKNINARI